MRPPCPAHPRTAAPSGSTCAAENDGRVHPSWCRPAPASASQYLSRHLLPVNGRTLGSARPRQLRQHIHTSCGPFAAEALDFLEAERCVKMQ